MERPVQNTEAQPLRERWSDFLSVKHQFASELDSISECSRAHRALLRSLSRWFKGPAEFEDALGRPAVLAICLPLLKNISNQMNASELALAARMGYCSLGPNFAFSHRWIRRLIYPMLILIAAAVFAVGFSCFLAPEFEDIFEEFGLALPFLTEVVLSAARLIRQFAALILFIPIGFLLLVLVLSWPGSGRQANLSWIDERFMSTRVATASWAWHISLLLDLGISQLDAIRAAGNATCNRWLQAISADAVSNRDIEQPSDEVVIRFYQNFQLLACAMGLPMSAGKIVMLRKVADYYWDHNFYLGDWWLSWFMVLTTWLVALAVVFCVFSLFLPLVSIISGLVP